MGPEPHQEIVQVFCNMLLLCACMKCAYRDSPAERLGYLRGGLRDIKCHRYAMFLYTKQFRRVIIYVTGGSRDLTG